MLNASGKPGVAARFHLLELLPFVFMLFLFVKFWGANGAAWAWTLRVSVDAALLFLAARVPRSDCGKLLTPALIVVAASVVVRLDSSQTIMRYTLAAIAISAAILWSIAAAPRAMRLRLTVIVRQGLLRRVA
jgi:hypothetical protein